MECPQCHKTNEADTNFCGRCGYDISKTELKQCSICLDKKKLEVLICGHLVCLDCMEKQYQIKAECPECRKVLLKCTDCGSFRVLCENNMEKCLACLKEVKISPHNQNTRNRKVCIDCQSNRLLYNHINGSWNCLDCFRNFTIDNGEVRVAQNINPTTIICLLCCSNNLTQNNEMETKCLNCLHNDVKTKCISLEEYSLLRIKTREEVNGYKVKKCIECQGEKIVEMMDYNCFDKIYYCHTCNKHNVKVYES